MRHFFNDAVERIAALIRTNFPSGFLEPLGLALVLNLWPSLLLFAGRRLFP
jgi:hypothetical protein